MNLQEMKKEDYKEDSPVIPTPPGHTPKDHMTQSVLAIVAAYLILGALVLISAMVTGVIALPHAVLIIVVLLSPVFTAFTKDFFHWMNTGVWSVTENE